MEIAYCIECGCHDLAACVHERTGQPCSWLVVDRDIGKGVCSVCRSAMKRWRRGDREVAVPVDVEVQVQPRMVAAVGAGRSTPAATPPTREPAYMLTREMLDTVTDLELAFSTDRLLAPWDAIPDEFKERSNVYSRLAENIFFDRDLGRGQLSFREGFEDKWAPAALNRCVRAHLHCFGVKHEHKIAGVAYMISLVCEWQVEPDHEVAAAG